MLHVSLLGARTVVDDATGEIRSRSSRTLALIALLASHAGTPQPRSRIAGTFWPDSPEPQALTNLRRELHHLRVLLRDDESVVVTARDLTWCDGAACRVDLRDSTGPGRRPWPPRPTTSSGCWRSGAAALAAYRGELLPGLYDEWTLARREELAQACGELCALVTDAARRTGHWDVALRAARRRVELAPLDEEGHRQLIRLQAARGDRAGAMRTFHHCAGLLLEELGHRARRRHQEAGRGPRRAAAGRAARRRVPAAAATPPAPAAGAAVGLVGRRAELRALEAALDGAFAGSVRAALVVGEAGVGHEPARGRGGPAGPLAATPPSRSRTATASRAGSPSRPSRTGWRTRRSRPASESLPPLWRAEVARLVPAPGGDTRPDGSRGVVDAWQRHRFFQALARALASTGRPVMLVLENLQWCDAETLDFLSFLLAVESREPLLVVLTGRRGTCATPTTTPTGCAAPVPRASSPSSSSRRSTSPRPASWSAAHRPEPTWTRGRSSARRPAASRCSSWRPPARGRPPGDRRRPTSTRCCAPASSSSGPGPPGAGLAAATGRDFDLELLCEAATCRRTGGAGGRRAVAAADPARAPPGYDFSHDLLRAAAYHLVSPPGRWLLHRRLAQALEILYAGRTDEVAAQLADQYARAGNPARAIEHYHQAAEVAARIFAHAEAIRLHRAALEQLAGLPPGADRDLREVRTSPRWRPRSTRCAGLLRRRAGVDPGAHGRAGRAALPAAMLVDALVGLWASRFVQGDICGRARAGPAGRRARRPAPGRADRGTWRPGALRVGRVGAVPGDARDGRPALRDRLAHATDEQSLSIGSHPAIHARAWSAHAYWLLGERPGRGDAAEAIDRARAVEHPYSLAIALGYAAVTWQLLGKREHLGGARDELEELSTRHGFAYYPEWGRVLRRLAAGRRRRHRPRWSRASPGCGRPAPSPGCRTG